MLRLFIICFLVFFQVYAVYAQEHNRMWSPTPLPDDVKQSLHKDNRRKASSSQRNTSQAQAATKVIGGIRYAVDNAPKYMKGERYFKAAYKGLSQMVDEERPYNAALATFFVENALLRIDTDGFKDFRQYLNHYRWRVKAFAKQEGLDLKEPMAVHFCIQKLYQDTLFDHETASFYPPLIYDFEDYNGEVDYASTFVSKLMSSNTGQCKSMPLLYVLLAKSFGVEARLAISPNHSYVVFWDKDSSRYNFECTIGMLTTDAWVMGSGLIKSEAIRSRAYMSPLKKPEELAFMYVELAHAHIQEYGYNRFVEQCIDKALNLHAHSLQALALKSNYLVSRLQLALLEERVPKNTDDLSPFPKSYGISQQISMLQKQMEELGYAEMPKEAYEEWLRSLEKEKARRESEKLKVRLKPQQKK